MNAPATSSPTPPEHSGARAPLKSLDDALAELLTHSQIAQKSLGSEQVPTFEADGRVLAQDVVSALHVPPADNSSMYGYALRCADVAQAGVQLPVTQRIAAGAVGQPLAAGSVARIFTGAPIPPGADAVGMQEDCEIVGGGAGSIDTRDAMVRVNALPQPASGSAALVKTSPRARWYSLKESVLRPPRLGWQPALA